MRVESTKNFLGAIKASVLINVRSCCLLKAYLTFKYVVIVMFLFSGTGECGRVTRLQEMCA